MGNDVAREALDAGEYDGAADLIGNDDGENSNSGIAEAAGPNRGADPGGRNDRGEKARSQTRELVEELLAVQGSGLERMRRRMRVARTRALVWRGTPNMKIAIAGKGGSGKTTIAGILTRLLAESGREVWAIDADSNPNFCVTLGVPPEKVQQSKALPASILKEVKGEDGKSTVQLAMLPRQVAEDFGLRVSDRIKLLGMHTIEHAGAGCACGGHARVRHFLSGILKEEGVVTVVDMEAGLEHLSRGTDRHVDLLLVVTEPYFKALETARRCTELARELGIPRIVAIANKFRSLEELAAIRAYAMKHGLEIVGEIPYDEQIQRSDIAAEAPTLDPQHAGVSAVRQMANRLEILATAA